jgi:D-glycero-alpha-D-manno-heptose-7-phosphate kinase
VIVEAKTPNRVDLAGGTLDIFPISVFEEGSVTVNMAVTLMSSVRLETRADARVIIRALDLDEEVEAEDVDALPLGGPLDLLCRAVRFYRPTSGLTIETRNSVRKGSGLGASSALLIALTGALLHLDGRVREPETMVYISSLLEAQTLQMLTGTQDYYAAVYGGINAIWFGVGRNRVEPLQLDAAVQRELHDRLVLSFAGEPRVSGLTNWIMVRRYLDGHAQTVRNMREIKASAVAMADCLRAGDLDAFGRNLGREWACRRTLAEGVTTEAIDAMIEHAAKRGAVASKLCGAGGGGCMITFVEAGARAAVEASLRGDGAEILDYEIASTGLEVETVG